MSFMTRSARCALIAAAIAHGALALGHSQAQAAAKAGSKDAAAQGQGNPASEAQQAAKRAYDAGIKAFGAAKYQSAVDQLNVALRGGGLGTAEMAKGLYVRGAAYRKLNKPALAISDLTSALWLKNGLNDADRQAATAERAQAYKAAGITDAAPAPVARTDAVPDAAPVVPAAAPAAPASASASGRAISPALAGQQQVAASEGGFPQPLSLGGESAVPSSPQYARTEDKATSGGAINQAAALEQPYSSTPSAPVSAQQPAFSAAPMDGAATPVGSTASAAGAGSGISGFFSNLFGGSTSPSQAPEAVQTASTGPATASPVSPQASSWNSTSLSQGSTKQTAKTAALAPQQAASPAPAAPTVPVKTAKTKSGKYKLHIAAVRSREEAEALAKRLNAEHGAQFQNRQAAVDEAVIGSMGTFFRVRVGGYANQEEPRSLCNSLRNSGYDCLVVTN